MPERESSAIDVRWPTLDVRAAAFDRLGACAAVLDDTGAIVDTNQAWRLFAQLNDGEPISTGVGVNYLDVCDRAAAAGVDVSGEVAAGLRQILSGERDQVDAEYACPSPTEDRWFMLQASALPVRAGAGAAVFHVDITARKHLTDRLAVLADHDALTGLGNRRAAVRYLDEGLELARATDRTMWAMFIDIDDFKSVNDTFGHHIGDELLVKVALRADRALRDGEVLCRFGGDEFVVICPGSDREQMAVVADRLRDVMSSPFQIGEVELFGRISVGLTESNPTSTAESMLHAADRDMYVDKRRGRTSTLASGPRSSPVPRRPLNRRPVAPALGQGDEFIVARRFNSNGTDPGEFGGRLRDMLGESPAGGDDHVTSPRLSFSVGVTLTNGADSPETIVADADAAMGDAKRTGGDRVVVFDDDARARATRRRTLATDLALVLAHDELRVEYQPIVDLDNCSTVGFEALLRWTHPDLGDISPAEFIPIAESDKLIGPIGDWVVDHAIQQLAEWRHDPRVPAGLWMAVNVSAQQLSQGRLAERVRESLHRTGVSADEIHLEITESVLMDRTDHALATVAELHSLGINLSIDDFGTGYSSLSYLSRLPVNSLKIDRSFVSALSASRGGTSIVRAIITLAQSLELGVVAEGVETSQQLETLRELGCTNGQGFLWSRSLPADDAVQWLTNDGQRFAAARADHATM